MPSIALEEWQTTRSAVLDKLNDAHSHFATGAPGRQWLTEEINHALIVRLAGEFQGFCRDLHTETTDHLFDPVTIPIPGLRLLVRAAMNNNRKLDSGNANPSSTNIDFQLLGINLWGKQGALAANPRYKTWNDSLTLLNEARNAVAHQNREQLRLFTGAPDPNRPNEMVKPRLNKSTIDTWRKRCARLAVAMDAVAGDHVETMTGVRPWLR